MPIPCGGLWRCVIQFARHCTSISHYYPYIWYSLLEKKGSHGVYAVCLEFLPVLWINIDDFDHCTKKLDITISQYSLFLKVLCLLFVDYHILVGSVACTPCFCLDSLVAFIVQFRFWIPAYIFFLFLLLNTSTFCHLTMILV